MPIGIDSVFNSSGEIGSWLSASSTNMTGSLFLSVLVILAFLFLIMMLFRMPELLMFIIIFPLLIVLSAVSEISVSMRIIVGIGIALVALGLYAFYPSK